MNIIKKLIEFILKFWQEYRDYKSTVIVVKNTVEKIKAIEIIDKKDLYSKYHKGFPRNIIDIDEIVIHCTGGGNDSESLFRYIKSGERSEGYKKGIGFYHYNICQTGLIYQTLTLEKWSFNSDSGWHDKCTIHISLMNSSFTNSEKSTKKQYKSLVELIDHIINDGLQIKRIVGHDYNFNKYSQNKKGCPGAGFNWKTFEKLLSKNDIEFNKIFEQSYEVIV